MGVRGCYGIALRGFDAPELNAIADPLATLDVRFDDVEGDFDLTSAQPIWLGPERAEIATREGRIRVSHAELVLPSEFEARARAVPHPYFALPAAMIHHWRGATSLHAGAVTIDGRAWAIVAPKAGGKSSLVATLGAEGAGVVCDDLLVIDAGDVLAGPRSVDLRPDMAGVVATEDLGVMGARPRHRFVPAAVPDRTPLAGFVHLAWGDDERGLDRFDASQSIGRLMDAVGLGVHPRNPEALLDLVELPAYRFSRPARARDARDDARWLIEALGARVPLAG